MDKVRCLLIQFGLPKTFWAEATCTVAYLINRSPSRAIEKKTPMEMWSGYPSDYGMLRIFGCVVYPYDKQGKLEPRAVKCVLLGYPDGVKGYKLYKLDYESPKIVTSRNMVFNESVMYKDTLKDSGAGADKSVEELQGIMKLIDTNLTDYQLARDKEPRTRMKPLRFRDESNMAAYAFVAAEEEDTHEPLTYQEAVAFWAKAGELQMVVQDKRRDLNVFKSLDYTRKGWCSWIPKGQLEQLDVKTAFLHGNFEEVIYMRQPPRYEQDDMLIACKSKAEIRSTKKFDIKELGEAKMILGMEIVRDRSRKILRVSHSGYVSKILNNFRIDNGKSVKMPLGGHFKLSLKNCPVRDCDVERMSKVPYVNAVGSLMYLMVCTRLDIVYAGIANVDLVYGTNRGNHVDVTGFVDSDYAKDLDKDFLESIKEDLIERLDVNAFLYVFIELISDVGLRCRQFFKILNW
ncbi:retrotransposon protein, putative, ty1-copia subclass [Tanacetum coccineum]|uniref:Retrotransposon protein, putative, ty1-copia subclass n=1 Tax=Tanacetum coccineum TaxID=301880 RepID=A0ABQ5F655_9ASTR